MVLSHLLSSLSEGSLPPRPKQTPSPPYTENPKSCNAETLRFSVYNYQEEGALNLVSNFSKTLSLPCDEPLMQSCLGLVCIFETYGRCLLICNSSTRDLICLPPINDGNVCIGFGFAASTQEYKVFGFFSGEMTGRCQIFTLGTSHWREGRTTPYYVFNDNAPFLHGAIRFLTRNSMQYGVKDTDYIAVLDVDTEEYRQEIRLPAYYYSLGDCEGRGTREFMCLTLLRGSLCLTFDFAEHKWLLELWLLKDYNTAEWVKGYTIDVSVYPYSCYSFQACPVDTEGDDILLDCRDDVGFCLLGYSPQDGTVTVKKKRECAATSYIETFYPLRR